MASDHSDTDSDLDCGCGDSLLAPKLSSILEQVKKELPSVNLDSSDESSDEELTVFQRSGPVSVLTNDRGRFPSEDLNKVLKDQTNGGIALQIQSEKNAQTSGSTSTSAESDPSRMPLFNNYVGGSAIGVLESSLSRTENSGSSASGGLFDALEAALQNRDGGQVIDLGDIDENIINNDDVVTSNDTGLTSNLVSATSNDDAQLLSDSQNITFSDGFLARVESAILNRDDTSNVIILDEVATASTDTQTMPSEIQELPWESITFTDGFLQRVESEFSSQNASAIDVDLDTYDLCDIDVSTQTTIMPPTQPVQRTERSKESTALSCSSQRPSRLAINGTDSNSSTSTSQRLESQNVISRYFTDDIQTTLLDSLRNINIDDLLRNDLENITAPRSSSPVLRPPSPLLPEQGEASGGPSLIEQLARLSSSQSGVDLNNVDPKSGARLKVTKLSTKQEKTEQNLLEVKEQIVSDVVNTPISIGTSTTKETLPEPDTVYLDLRNFDAEKRRQEEGVQAVQRILRARPQVDESSSDEDDEAPRLLWHEQRRQMKAALASGRTTPASQPIKSAESKTTSITTTARRNVAPRQLSLAGRTKRTSEPEEKNPDEKQLSGFSGVQLVEQILKEEVASVECRSDDPKDSEVVSVKKIEDEAKIEKAEQQRLLFEKKRKQQQSRIRLHERLNSLRPTVSSRGHHSAAEATPTIYDIEASYESTPSTLPYEMDSSVETLLLSVRLSSNGEMIAHRAKNNRSVDPGDGLSASYIALLTWLLNLVPDNFDFLMGRKGQDNTKKTQNIEEGAPFKVIGLEQLVLRDELSLFVAIFPSDNYLTTAVHHSKKPTQEKSKSSSTFQQVVQKYLSTNTLHSACWWLEDLTPIAVRGPAAEGVQEGPFTYTPTLPVITKRPLATFVQVNPDPAAVKKIFQMETSFFWATMENNEMSCDIELKAENDLHGDTQNTMSLIYKKVYREPRSMMGILNRLPQEGLDLAGVRLLYPSLTSLNPELNINQSPTDVIQALNKVGPITALAIRGRSARQIWLDAIGPSDPVLARKTDPQSLCALYGGNSREECLLFTPRNPTRILYELTLWFGPRVPPGGTINVGQVQQPSGGGEGNYSEEEIDSLPSKPPNTLSATANGDVILALSPLLPVRWFGILLNLSHARGYQLRGVRRCKLTTKKVNALGISSKEAQYFRTVIDDRKKGKSSPATLLLLNKENAIHHAGSLVEVLMVRMTMMGLLGKLQEETRDPLTSEMLFRCTSFSGSLLMTLGGEFSRVQDVDVHTAPGYIAPQIHNNPELEQVCLLTLTGSTQVKSLGLLLDQLLRPSSHSSAVFELVGIKWLPTLSNMQASELTPYEVGDREWKRSVQTLMQRQVVILVLRGVNAYERLKVMFKTKSPYGTLSGSQKSLDRLLSPSVDIAFQQVRFFFSDKELFPDNTSRPHLPFLPPVTRHFQSGRVHPSVNTEEERLEESILSSMLRGPRPISTMLVIKPDGMRHLAKILKKISQEGFRVVGMKMKVIARSEVKVILPNEVKGNCALEDLHLSHMTKDSSVILCLQRENAVKRLVDLLGPADPREARRCENGYLRGIYGADPVANALHGSADYRASVTEIKSLFPEGLCCKPNTDLASEEIQCPAVDEIINVKGPAVRKARLRISDPQTVISDGGTTSLVSCLGVGVQTKIGPHVTSLSQTNCLVLMPSLVTSSSRSARTPPYIGIIEHLLRKGCELIGLKMMWFTQEQAEAFLHVINAGSYQMAPLLTSGPSIIVAIQSDNAILTFDVLLGGSFDKESLYSKHNKSILSARDGNMASKMLAFFFDSLVSNAQCEVFKS